jgi:opacity protein-like surface antigen
MRQIGTIIASFALLLGVSAMAQESRSEISLQGTGSFTKDASDQGITQRSTNTGGFIVGYRYHFNRWLAAEAVYGYDRNTQQYFAPAGLSRLQANVHQATGGLVFRVPAPARFRISPYVLAEGGALVFDPTGNAFGTIPGAQRQATGVFAYGGGADFPIVRHISLRAEYRGLVCSTPDFGLTALKTNTVSHTAQPSAGLVFRF